MRERKGKGRGGEKKKEKKEKEREREREREMASYLTGADDGAFSAAPTVATGFMGKPVLDIRLVKPEGLAKLTRSQMRDIMYSLGKDKPSWTREILREQMAAIVRALMTPQTFGDLSQLKAFEDELGITLPKPGFPWQPRSVSFVP